ncbi:MAG: VanZ family protein [Thermomicrobiales bacterium]|nr:VanZ family protein [Thermomicrobiales bacterium]
MHQWVWSAQAGIVLGTATFLMAFVPLLIWQYRHYGRWSMSRMLGAAATAIYFTAIATYTWLPLPPRSVAWCELHGITTINLTPFAFMDDVRGVVAAVGRRQALRSEIVLQVVFNVVLFIPWGIIVRRFFGRGFIFTVVSGFLASVFVEMTQATGLWGIYDCAYRWADIDDVMTNTAGAFIGAVIAPVVLFWMPRAAHLSASRLTPRPITIWRRYTSMFITMAAVMAVNLAGVVSVRIGLLVLDRPLDGRLERWLEIAVVLGVTGLFLYIPALLGHGNVGMQTVWLSPRWRIDGEWTKGTILQRTARASVIGLPYMASEISDASVLTLLVWGVVGLSLVLVPFTRGKRSLSCLLMGAELVDVRSESDRSP